MQAYCVKCKVKRDIVNPVAVFTAKGTPATRGTCEECGTSLFRMGVTEAHAGLERPVVQRSADGADGRRAPKRSGKLVIVESPAKARTVGRFLGKGYSVKASVGHVRDLLRSQLSVDVENDFAPKYRVPNEKRAVVKELKQDIARANELFLATDPDREGEAIAWHLMEAVGADPQSAQRVVFHEITQPAVQEAFAHARPIDMDLVNAQQARRVLDRLVGYSLSPLLWAKVRGRLSAGRVQSVAVRLVVDRERQIEAFVPQEYWSIGAELAQSEAAKRRPFVARLIKVDEQDAQLPSEAAVQPVQEDLEHAVYSVTRVKSGERKRNPSAPFSTSSLQQEASRRLGFTARRTMSVAQQLYEGVDVGNGGTTGLITYMRTDGAYVSPIAQQEAREYIGERFGADYFPAEPPTYKARAKSAQESHEAIRPTSVMREPKALQEFLSRDQFRLYTLVWQRFLASQMAPAIYDTVSVDIEARSQTHVYLLRVSGSSVKFNGYLAVYEEARDEDAQPEEDEVEGKLLPRLEAGEALDLLRVLPEQHFTQPPPRYSEATLVKALEEHGIGRPSTYAPILGTIQQRGYVVREDKRLAPTDTGRLVNDLLVEHFPEVVDLAFTAHMEADLDEIAQGDRDWVPVLREFYEPFAAKVRIAQEAMPEVKAGPEPVGRDCPDCGRPLIFRWGRYGKFIGCSGFPECRHVEPFLEHLGVKCPLDGGELVSRKTRKGRTFYGCENYPACEFTSWKRPLPTACPNCGGLLVALNKQTAECTSCKHQVLVADALPE